MNTYTIILQLDSNTGEMYFKQEIEANTFDQAVKLAQELAEQEGYSVYAEPNGVMDQFDFRVTRPQIRNKPSTMLVEDVEIPYNAKFADFIDDMDRDGSFVVELYNGRNSYKGPAVRCDRVADVMSVTTVPCTWDNMGLGWIVYPTY